MQMIKMMYHVHNSQKDLIGTVQIKEQAFYREQAKLKILFFAPSLTLCGLTLLHGQILL